eukprot:COSAG02_NODE_49616_length_325_cov_1.371681_2_plen_38_part_01
MMMIWVVRAMSRFAAAREELESFRRLHAPTLFSEAEVR